MNILVPLNERACLAEYIAAGANEFYLGFGDDAWTSTFGEYADINRMSGFRKRANQYSFEEMIDVIADIKASGQRAFITMNANTYSKAEIEYIARHYVPAIREVKADGIIASDPNLIKVALAEGVEPVASTMLGIYNSDIARYYLEMGMRRMILPRDLSLDEICTITTKTPEVEYEVFFMRNGCAFSDGFCLGMHGECGSTCEFIRNHLKRIHTTYTDFEDVHAFDVNDYLYSSAFHRHACGMCALYRMISYNVSSLKIVGRADIYKAVCDDIRLTRDNIEIAHSCATEEEYLKRMIFPDGFNRKCMMGFSCYYPEVRFK